MNKFLTNYSLILNKILNLKKKIKFKFFKILFIKKLSTMECNLREK